MNILDDMAAQFGLAGAWTGNHPVKIEIPRSPHDRNTVVKRVFPYQEPAQQQPWPPKPVRPEVTREERLVLDPLEIPQHLASYREAMRREVPNYLAPYTQLLASTLPDLYRTQFDYLSAVMEELKRASATGHFPTYLAALQTHQTAMVTALDNMVADELWDYRSLSVENLKDLLANPEQGWRWFKHSRFGFKRTIMVGKTDVDVAFLPRYSRRHIHKWTDTCDAYLDAAETPLVFPMGLDGLSPATQALLEFKIMNPKQKILAVTGEGQKLHIDHLPVQDINNGLKVYDWTLPLLGAGE